MKTNLNSSIAPRRPLGSTSVRRSAVERGAASLPEGPAGLLTGGAMRWMLSGLALSLVPLASAADPAEWVPARSLGAVTWSEPIGDEAWEQVERSKVAVLDLIDRFAQGELEDDDRMVMDMMFDAVEYLVTGEGAIALVDLTAHRYEPIPNVAFVLEHEEIDAVANLARRLAMMIGGEDVVRSITFEGMALMEIPDEKPSDEAEAPLSIVWGTQGQRFALYAGEDATREAAALLNGVDAPLKRSQAYRTALSRAETDYEPFFTFWFDFDDFFDRLVETDKQMGGSGPDEEEWLVIRELGIDRIGDVYLACAESGHGIEISAWLELGKPWTGLLTLADQEPLSGEDYQLIPRDAYWAVAFNLDLAAIYDELMRLDEVFGGPDSSTIGIRERAAALNHRLGFSIRDDMLASLGDTFILYDSPSQGSMLFTNTALIVEVRNGPKLREVFGKLATVVRDGVEDQFGYEPRVVESSRFGRKMRYLHPGGPFMFAPSASFVGDRVVCGLTPQAVGAALPHVEAPGRSLLEHPSIGAVGYRFPDNLTLVSFSDAKNALNSWYGISHMVMTSLANLAPTEDFNPLTLPTMPEVGEAAHDGIAALGVAEDGLVYRSFGGGLFAPLAGGMSGGWVGLAGVGVGVALPAVASARSAAEQTVALSELRQIGIGCAIYAAEHEGALPPDLDQLFEKGYLVEGKLRTSLDSVRYIAGHQTRGSGFDPNLVVAYRAGNRGDVQVLFLDGRVQPMPQSQFDSMLERTQLKLN